MLRQQRVGQGAAEVPEAPPPAPVAVKGSYNLVQVLVPLRPEAKPEAVRAANEKVQSQRAKTSSCAEASAFAKANGDPGAGKIGVTPANKLPPPVLAVLSSLKDGEPSPVLRNERGVLFLVVCSRKGVEPSAVPAPTVTSGKIDREKIAMRLAGQKMELLARRYLRDLRQSAFIDIRN
jgi:peptidyl-prolyl cis-trans isomerase SurA